MDPNFGEPEMVTSYDTLADQEACELAVENANDSWENLGNDAGEYIDGNDKITAGDVVNDIIDAAGDAFSVLSACP